MINAAAFGWDIADVIFVDFTKQANDELSATMPNIKPDSYLKLSVSDTRCGIPSKIGDKIFKPYLTTKEKGCVRHELGSGRYPRYHLIKQYPATCNFCFPDDPYSLHATIVKISE